MNVMRLIFCVMIVVQQGVGGEEILPSIQRGEWGLKLNSMQLWHLANWPEAAEPLPDQVWADLPRRVVPIKISLDAANEKVRDGSWIPYVQSQVSSLEDVVLCIYGDKKGDLGYTEFEPTATPEQEAWCRGLVDRWTVPLPEGFVQVGPGGGYVSAWDHWKWWNSSKIKVTRRAVPKQGSGGPEEKLFWYDRSMTDEAMLIEVVSATHYLEFRRDLGGTVAIMRVPNPNERIQVSWPSGQFLLCLNVPKEMYRTRVKAYLERYPSTWPEQIDYDPQRLMLQVLSEAITEMTKHLDGPLESLRYSFKSYPFDDACHRAWNIIPDKEREQRHREAIRAIRSEWAKTPADRIKLSDYHDAMIAYRRKLIESIIAERDRIATEGVEREKVK